MFRRTGREGHCLTPKERRKAERQQVIEARREKKRAAFKQLRQERQRRSDGDKAERASLSNGTSPYATVAAEEAARHEATLGHVAVMRAQMPALLKRLQKIDDFRNPKKIKHKLTIVLIYGILAFVYQMASRREANRKMTRPMFLQNLQTLFPELEMVPHQDTLNRLLIGIEVNELETIPAELVRKFIRQKKFARYLIDNSYPIAIDGTQKHVSTTLPSAEWQQRTINKGKEGEKTHYYVYVLEANLSFANGMVIPLMTEFLDYTEGDTGTKKQDCELKAFKRLAARLKREFSHLRIMLLLDGLYANGPVMEICRKNKWQFMIVLKDDSLPCIWEQYHGFKKLLPKNIHTMTWGNRTQTFRWVNDIKHYFGPNQRHRQTVHLVVCEETWEEVDNEGTRVTRHSRHAWLSSKPLHKNNLHQRCNLSARYRWGIEESILVEKRQGYQYEHRFSHDWNAMRGYHYLMRLGHLFNVLATYSTALYKMGQILGIRPLIDFIRETIAGPWLDYDKISRRLEGPLQLRLE